MKKILEIAFVSFEKSVPEILIKANLAKLIKDQKTILIKPNLTTNLPPPCTTPVELIEEIVKYCQQKSKAQIVIAEGSGGCDTQKAFLELGYQKLVEKYNVKLIDLNREQRIEKTNPQARTLKKVKLPKIIFESFFINVPVLKHHDQGILTCATKNLFGLYLNEGLIKKFMPNWWNKSELHFKYGVTDSVYDLNTYCPAGFVLVDGSIGQKGNEIHGYPCNPPLKKLIVGFDNLEVDRFSAPLLDLDPQTIDYLN